MNDILKYYLKTLSNSTLSLKKKSLLVENLGHLLIMRVKFKSLFSIVVVD